MDFFKTICRPYEIISLKFDPIFGQAKVSPQRVNIFATWTLKACPALTVL